LSLVRKNGTTRRRLLFVGAALAAGLVILLSLLPSAPPESESQERHLRIAIPDDVETVDPPFSHFQMSNEVNYNIYDPFFVYGLDESPTGYRVYNPQKILGSAVESWHTSADEETVVLSLRREARFA
jgi:ABC-type oligopeptide transport system substrate-binding subunit